MVVKMSMINCIMRPPRSSRKAANAKAPPPQQVSDTVCYCTGEREIGTLELFCSTCAKWFHGRCLQDLKDFYGLPFMVCYSFNCKECSPTKEETWTPKQANFVHMCVTVLANLTAEYLKNNGNQKMLQYDPVFFGLRDKIIPYVEENWENLTSMPRRVKNTWHQTIQKTLLNNEVFKEQTVDDEHSFALSELLVNIGPASEVVKSIQVGRTRNTEKTSKEDKTYDPDEGPKTRGAKRRNAEHGGGPSKKSRLGCDYAPTRVASLELTIDFPFNKDGYRYFLVERDPNVPEKTEDENDEDTAPRIIPAFLYRKLLCESTTWSSNDRASQLRLSEDSLSVTGHEGYSMIRATHCVGKGTWYYEVTFLKQPDDSHIRVGWSQAPAVLQACVGYNKFSYGWRSKSGTKFHDAHGHTYALPGYKEGDVLGILIHMPFNEKSPGPSDKYLPPSGKDAALINFKHNLFFEVHDDTKELMKDLKSLQGSYIEFFLNGSSRGVAYTDIYEGFYFPTVSLYRDASVRANFGPHMKHLPPKAKPMSERAFECLYEQTLSDMLYLLDNRHA